MSIQMRELKIFCIDQEFFHTNLSENLQIKRRRRAICKIHENWYGKIRDLMQKFEDFLIWMQIRFCDALKRSQTTAVNFVELVAFHIKCPTYLASLNIICFSTLITHLITLLLLSYETETVTLSTSYIKADDAYLHQFIVTKI